MYGSILVKFFKNDNLKRYLSTPSSKMIELKMWIFSLIANFWKYDGFFSDFICNLYHILCKMGVFIKAETNEQFILIIAVCSTVEDFSWKIVLDRHAIAFEPFNLISSEQTIRSHFAANERTWVPGEGWLDDREQNSDVES